MAPGTYPNGRITNSRCGKQSRTAVDRYSYTDKTTSRDDSSMFVSFYDSIRFFPIETFPFFCFKNCLQSSIQFRNKYSSQNSGTRREISYRLTEFLYNSCTIRNTRSFSVEWKNLKFKFKRQFEGKEESRFDSKISNSTNIKGSLLWPNKSIP